MKLGIGSYTYMWSIGFAGAEPAAPMTAMDLLRKACDLGVSVVQYGPNLPLSGLPEQELQELLAAAHGAAIELEIGMRGVQTMALRSALELALRCGSRLLRSVPELEDGRVPAREELRALLAAVEPDFRKARVRLALENSLMPAADLAGALAGAGSEWLGVTLDTVNSLAIPEGTREVARELIPWTRCLHVKDFVVKREWHMMGFRVEGRPAGQGQLDISWLLEQLGGAPAQPNAILELWPPEQETPAATVALEHRWAEESIAYLRQFIKE